MHHPTDSIVHTTAFVTPIVDHWLEQEIAQWVHYEGLIQRPMSEPCTAELYSGRKEVFYLTTHSTHSVTIIWCQVHCSCQWAAVLFQHNRTINKKFTKCIVK